MGFSNTWRCALILCALIMNHHVIMASLLHPDLMTMQRVIKLYKDKHEQETDTGDNQALPTSDDETKEYAPHRNSTSGLARHSRAQKRLFGLILFFVSLAVTIAATTVETIYDIKGCCGLGYSYLCGFETKFNREKTAVGDRAKAVDRRIEQATKKKENIQNLEDSLENTWKEINRIIKLQRKILRTVDPKIFSTMNRMMRKVTRKASKTTKGIDSMSLAEIENKMDPTKRNLMLFFSWTTGPVMMGAEKIASVAYKKFKVGKIYKTLKTTGQAQKVFNAAPKAQKLLGFTDDAAKGFLKATSLAKFGSKAGKVGKFFKVFKAAGAVMSVISIGLDLYSMISTFVQCGKKSDQAKKAMAEVEEAKRKVDESETQLNTFTAILETYKRDTLFPSVRQEALRQSLDGIRGIIDGMEKTRRRNWDYQSCLSLIPRVTQTLPTSNNLVTINSDLSEVTEDCMKPLQYTMKCWLAKTRLVAEVINNCRDGVQDLSNIYKKALSTKHYKLLECRNKYGEPYTSFEDVKEIVTKAAADTDFHADCHANNPLVQSTICRGTARGLNAKKIYRDLKEQQMIIAKSKVKEIMADCKTSPNQQKLSPKLKNEICSMKRTGIYDDEGEIVEELQEAGYTLSVEQVSGLKCKGM